MEKDENNENRLVINLLRIGAYLVREGDKISGKYGLNQQQFVVLNYINQANSVSQNQICSSLLLGKSNMSKIIAKLEKMDLVVRERSGQDARTAEILCTQKAKGILAAGIKDFDIFNKDFASGLSEAGTEKAVDSTEKICQLIKDRT